VSVNNLLEFESACCSEKKKKARSACFILVLLLDLEDDDRQVNGKVELGLVLSNHAVHSCGLLLEEALAHSSYAK
jgi:hypothetical protein